MRHAGGATGQVQKIAEAVAAGTGARATAAATLVMMTMVMVATMATTLITILVLVFVRFQLVVAFLVLAAKAWWYPRGRWTTQEANTLPKTINSLNGNANRYKKTTNTNLVESSMGKRQDLVDGHQRYQRGRGEREHPAEVSGPRWVHVVAVRGWFVLKSGHQQQELFTTTML